MDGFSPNRPPRAGNRTRTGDPNLGKVVLYQLSYSRMGPGDLREVPDLLRDRSLSPSRNTSRKLEIRSEGVNPIKPPAVFPNPFAPLDFLPFFGRARGLGPSLSLGMERKAAPA